MLPPMDTLSLIKFMHDELHEKRAASQLRELAVQPGENRITRLFRSLFHRDAEAKPVIDVARLQIAEFDFSATGQPDARHAR